MKTLRLEVELTYDDVLAHGGDADPAAKEWFLNDVLRNGGLYLHSQEIGDEVGKVSLIAFKPIE